MFRQILGAIHQYGKNNDCTEAPRRATTEEIEGFSELRKSGMGFDRIAATLNNEGAPTRRRGSRWQGMTVNQILKARGRLRG